jgi:hypothetical protein
LTKERSTLPVGRQALTFASGAIEDARIRLAATLADAGAFEGVDQAQAIVNASKNKGLSEIVTPYPTVGPVADGVRKLEHIAVQHGIKVAFTVRDWDKFAWPNCGKGFFALKERIPGVLELNGLHRR